MAVGRWIVCTPSLLPFGGLLYQPRFGLGGFPQAVSKLPQKPPEPSVPGVNALLHPFLEPRVGGFFAFFFGRVGGVFGSARNVSSMAPWIFNGSSSLRAMPRSYGRR